MREGGREGERSEGGREEEVREGGTEGCRLCKCSLHTDQQWNSFF